MIELFILYFYFFINMIKLLEHNLLSVAQEIHSVFQSSYAIEAKLLGADNFPPLNRSINDIVFSDNIFYAFYDDNLLVSVLEICDENNSLHIQSLVVSPDYFRKGIATKMINFVFANFKRSKFSVETGIDNIPARRLYQNHGFKELKKWMTNHGIVKIRYELYKKY